MSTVANVVSNAGHRTAAKDARNRSPDRGIVGSSADLFSSVAERWTRRWGISTVALGASDPELGRLERQLVVLAELLLDCDLQDGEDLIALLRMFAFFDNRQPWMQAGHFKELKLTTQYAEAIMLLSSLEREARIS